MQKLHFLLKLFGICALLNFSLAHDEDVHTIKYNTDNFAEELIKKHHFVMFYAPWCGHCQRLAPTWDQLAEMLNEDDTNIRIAKVDCTTDSRICSEQDITGYPTLKFFRTGETDGVRFRGTRDLPTLSNFINEQLRKGEDETASGEHIIQLNAGLTELTQDNFDKHVATGKHFVKFYAPWCGHCQKLAPVWDDLATTFAADDTLSVSKIDCTQHRPICETFEVKGYPTLLWIEDGVKIDKYQGDRSLIDLKSYATRMTGGSNALKESENDEASAVKSEASSVIEVKGDSFAKDIGDGVAFVKFFAPWCGHCKRLAPTWEELGQIYEHDKSIRIVKVDCTLDGNKQLCNDEEIEGFPSLFLYKNGKKVSEYNGDRSLEDMQNFVKKALGHDEL